MRVRVPLGRRVLGKLEERGGAVGGEHAQVVLVGGVLLVPGEGEGEGGGEGGGEGEGGGGGGGRRRPPRTR